MAINQPEDDINSKDHPAWVCPRCGSTNLRWMTTVTVSASMDKYHNLPKNAFKTKDVQIWGVNWDMRSISCMDCGTLLSEGLRPYDSHPNMALWRHFCPTCEGRGFVHEKKETQ